MKLVPVPLELLAETENVWLPFVFEIAQKTKQFPETLHRQIYAGEIHIHIAWDDEAQEAKALAGTQIVLRGNDRICELIWMLGSEEELWLPLFPDFERYHREELGCVGMKAISSPVFRHVLKERGYRMTHVLMEKEFT